MSAVVSSAGSTLAAGETLPIDDFGQGPFWVTLIKVVMVFAFLVVMTLFSIVFERKVVGRMQNRIGPNRTGPWGVLQSLADGMKLAFKEEIVPLLADKKVYFIAPILSAVPAFLAFSVVPFGPVVSMFGHRTPLQLTDLPTGVLIILSTSALGVYGLVLSGWASGSTYPLLGSLRSAAQVISYEVAMGLSLVSVFLLTGSMSTSQIVDYQGGEGQSHLWNVIPLIVPFAIYCIAIVGETNRAPFDLPEAESELVGGFHTEYSSFKFAMFFLAEYINMVTVAALGTTLFLGGWRAPWPISLWAGANEGWWPVLWFTGKVVVFIFVFVWLRGTLPRLRYDQFMSLGWKWLIPINLLTILAVATVQTLKNRGTEWYVVGLVLAVPLVIIVISATLAYETSVARRKAVAEADDLEEARMGPAFPVPPMDLRVPAAARATRSPTAGLTHEQRRKALAGARTGGDGGASDGASDGAFEHDSSDED